MMMPADARDLDLMVGRPPAADRLVTLSNWQGPPCNRWSFQHVGQLIPSARISRGDGPVLELPVELQDVDDLPFRTVAGATSTLRAHLEASYTDGFLALRHGRIVAEYYSNGMTPSTRHLLQSVSKSLTGALAGALVGSGALDPAGSVTDYVPLLRGTSFEGATVRQLLDMTAGTRFSEDYEDPGSDVRRYEIAAGWQPSDGEVGVDLAEYIAALPNRSAHGESFAYRSILTDALGMVVEGASARRFADAMSDLLWSRMGAGHDAEITVDRHGNALADGGVSVTLRDLARFGELYLRGGRLGGVQILPAAWVADTRLADPACREVFLASLAPTQAERSPAQQACAPRGHYRNQWWVLDPGAGIMMGSGIYGQYVYVDAATDVVLAKLSSLPRPLDQEIGADTLSAFASLAAHLGELA
jgi:CubicO group peptidase (beta-lactamase class C family)